MAQHKASFLLEKHGKLEVKTRPTPTPQKNQALVKVTAAAINPVDWKIIDYGIFLQNFPAVLGTDGAGVVEAVGPEVNDFKVGDRIFFQGAYGRDDETTFQEKAIVQTDIIAKIPDNITDDQASTIPVAAVAALVGLFQKTGIEVPVNGPTANGKGVLILGGSSSVGQFAIQLARIAGFSPIVTTASAQHNDFLGSLGATHVFDRDVDAKTVQSAFSTPVALVVDSISQASTQELAFEVLTTPSSVQGAHLAIVLRPPIRSHQFRDLSVPFWQTVGQWIKDEKLVPNRVQVVKGGLAAVPEALDLSRKGHKASFLLEKHGKLEVTAAAINPVDWKVKNFPAVLGLDGAGVVEAVGPEVTGFKVGDRVFFEGIYRSSDETTFQEKTIVETDLISKIPGNITDDQASTIPVVLLLRFLVSSKILALIASVGQFAIQLARIAGFSPIVTTASAQHNDFLKSLGATHVFGRDVDANTIQSAFSTPVALVLDAISTNSTQSLAFDILTTPSLAPVAHLAIVLPLADSVKEKNRGDKVTWIKDEKLVPNRVQVVKGGLAAVPEALDLSRKGVSGVKVVIHPQD
ncbi:Zinc-binding dehydrogenase [Rhizoctonia solani]|uniref:Zinc-binding dehydrogenase n=1 Tax=Rhizoctonia solani TaxID=456999 RepID=A0A8H8NR95_9AGAM|nr:Zinc-binding dehydrogenase [Rhizoctonia solani]QRW16817.1 Zinc-binding dehydrogenase [Rhizoctonia solani]